jgi:hypothetical protein
MKIICSSGNLYHIGYDSDADRRRGIQALRSESFNYFVTYRDTAAEFALQATRVTDLEVWPLADNPAWYTVQ